MKRILDNGANAQEKLKHNIPKDDTAEEIKQRQYTTQQNIRTSK